MSPEDIKALNEFNSSFDPVDEAVPPPPPPLKAKMPNLGALFGESKAAEKLTQEAILTMQVPFGGLERHMSSSLTTIGSPSQAELVGKGLALVDSRKWKLIQETEAFCLIGNDSKGVMLEFIEPTRPKDGQILSIAGQEDQLILMPNLPKIIDTTPAKVWRYEKQGKYWARVGVVTHYENKFLLGQALNMPEWYSYMAVTKRSIAVREDLLNQVAKGYRFQLWLSCGFSWQDWISHPQNPHKWVTKGAYGDPAAE